MKKHLLTLLAGVVALPLALSGCTASPLANSPTQTANIAVNGSALTYTQPDKSYIYFANAFQSASAMDTGYNAKNTGLKRVALNADGTLNKDDKKLPTGHEDVINKVIGSENTVMHSSGQYIYFATPNDNVDPASHGKHLYNYNKYFRINTDGTGLTSVYQSRSTITQQTFLTVTNNSQTTDYLVLVDQNKAGKNILVAINLATLKVTTLAEDIKSAIFASSYQTTGDEIAYYLKDASSNTEGSQQGDLLFGVNITTGNPTVGTKANPEALNQSSHTDTLTLKKVFNGVLHLIINNTNTGSVYAVLDNSISFTHTEIATGITDSIKSFDVTRVENQIYYVFSTDNGTYATTGKLSDFETGKILDVNISILFSYDDFVYFTYADTDAQKGIYRVSVYGTPGNTAETITDLEEIKTTNVAFDGNTYVYYFAQNSDNTTGAYYMHRSKVNINQSNAELISALLADDMPKDEENQSAEE